MFRRPAMSWFLLRTQIQRDVVMFTHRSARRHRGGASVVTGTLDGNQSL